MPRAGAYRTRKDSADALVRYRSGAPLGVGGYRQWALVDPERPHAQHRMDPGPPGSARRHPFTQLTSLCQLT
jgi:hypothetical protein